MTLSQKSHFITSPRLGFGHWSRNDMPLARQLWGDPQVTKLISKDPFSDQQVAERLQKEIETAEAKGYQYWPLVSLEDGGFVGVCGFKPHASGHDVLEFGFHLCPDYWGRGFATEAGERALAYAFEKLGQNAIFAGHHPHNKASRNALIKLGFIGAGAEFYERTGLDHPSYYLYQNPPSAFRTRRAVPSDAHALALVHQKAINKTFGELLPAYVSARNLDDFESAWEERFAKNSCETLVLLRGLQIVGFVSAAKSEDDDADGSFGDVDRIYLHPSVWGNRQGDNLLKWCEQQLAGMGYKDAKLWVFEVNSRARKFYERHGFAPDGATKEAYGARLLRYSKPL